MVSSLYIAALLPALAAADEYFTGDGTAYTLGQLSAGNCNMMMSGFSLSSTNYAAINSEQWSNLANCGRCAEVSCADSRCADQSTSVVVQILDQCPECSYGDLDLSPSVFKTITGSSPARYSVKWKFVDCPISGNVNICLKSGSNAYWTAVQPANVRTGVASLSINGAATTMLGSAYYYLLDGQSKSQTDLSAVTVSITDVYGQTIEETVSLSDGECTEGSAQFPASSGSSTTYTSTSAPATKAPTTTAPTSAPATTSPAPTTTEPAPTTAAPAPTTQAPTTAPVTQAPAPTEPSSESVSPAPTASQSTPTPETVSPVPSLSSATPTPTPVSTPEPTSTPEPISYDFSSAQSGTQDNGNEADAAGVSVDVNASATTSGSNSTKSTPNPTTKTPTPTPTTASSNTNSSGKNTQSEQSESSPTATPTSTPSSEQAVSSPSTASSSGGQTANTQSGGDSNSTLPVIVSVAGALAAVVVAVIAIVVVQKKKKALNEQKAGEGDDTMITRSFDLQRMSTPAEASVMAHEQPYRSDFAIL